MRPEGSITHWIWELKEGDQAAAQQELWNRYFHRLIAPARTKLRGMPRRVEDEEDVALRAPHSFFQRPWRGRIEQEVVTMPKPMDRRWMRKKPSFRPPLGFSASSRNNLALLSALR